MKFWWTEDKRHEAMEKHKFVIEEETNDYRKYKTT